MPSPPGSLGVCSDCHCMCSGELAHGGVGGLKWWQELCRGSAQSWQHPCRSLRSLQGRRKAGVLGPAQRMQIACGLHVWPPLLPSLILNTHCDSPVQ